MANVSVVGPAGESSYLKYNGRKLPWGFLACVPSFADTSDRWMMSLIYPWLRCLP